MVVYLKSERAPTHEDVANLHDSDVARLERLWGRPIFADEVALVAFETVITFPAQVGGEFFSKSLKEQSEQVVLRFRDLLRQGWSGDPAALERIGLLAQAAARIVPAENGQLELVVDDLLGMVSILFLRDFAAGRLGKCANPDCRSPYFARSRKTQRFCDEPVCMVYSHRISANNYWSRRRAKEQLKPKKGKKQ